MRTSRFIALTLLFSNLFGCMSAPHTTSAEHASLTNGSQASAPIPAETLGLNENRISMNVEGGFIRKLSEEFEGETRIQMRILEEHATTKWSPLAGVCLKETSSEASACMQFVKIPQIGPEFRAMFYYRADAKSPRQHEQVLVDHKATVGQAVRISIKQQSEQLIFSIEGKDEIFPVSLKAGVLEFHCSSGVCEFRN